MASIEAIVGQGFPPHELGMPSSEGDGAGQPWFRSSSPDVSFQTSPTVGVPWDSPESAANPRGVTGRIPVAPLPAVSLPAPLRMGSKAVTDADLGASNRSAACLLASYGDGSDAGEDDE